MKKKLKRVSCLLFILMLTCLPWFLEYLFAKERVEKIDELLNLYYSFGELNGAVLVAENGKIIYKKAFGLANRELNVSNQTDSRFNIHSMSKQFTAALIMQLKEEGKLKLDGKISDYLPAYPKEIGEKVTIHQLLTHTHGIPEPDYNKLPLDISGPADKVLKEYMSKPFKFEPGSKFEYSGLVGYAILGAIIEKLSGKSYEEVLTRRILKPLNMKNSGYANDRKIVEKKSTSYIKTRDYRFEKRVRNVDPLFTGATNIYSTVDDLYLWDRALSTGPLLTKESRDLLLARHANVPYNSTLFYGYGWYITDFELAGKKRFLAEHGGGRCNAIIRAPHEDRLVVLLGNTTSVYPWEITHKLMQILYNGTYELPKRSLQEALYKIIEKKGIEAAIPEYHRLKKEFPDTYEFHMMELSDLGYLYYSQGKMKKSIEIFKFNLELFPDQFAMYHGLGDAYKEVGKRDLAIKNLKKALELNPRKEDWEKNIYKQTQKILKELE